MMMLFLNDAADGDGTNQMLKKNIIDKKSAINYKGMELTKKKKLHPHPSLVSSLLSYFLSFLMYLLLSLM